MELYPIHRISITRVQIEAKCIKCNKMMYKSQSLDDCMNPKLVKITCNKCKVVYQIVANLQTSIMFGDTKMIMLK